jgi:hypothetical protein
MGNLYVRVGNRTLKNQEYSRLTQEQKQKFVKEGEEANKRRIERMQKALGFDPTKQNILLDVTPAGVAKRNAAIKAEEAKIAAENAAEIETPDETEKSKGKSKKKIVASE